MSSKADRNESRTNFMTRDIEHGDSGHGILDDMASRVGRVSVVDHENAQLLAALTVDILLKIEETA